METSRHVFNEFIELCRTATDNDTVVLRLLQQKYNQANRHFVWSDEFCKLVETYSARIRADPANKYVHIRDIVSELRAYKAKPMKQVITTAHDIELDIDHSTESDSCPHAKRAKMERLDVKREQEYISSSLLDAAPSLPPLLRFSSNLCTFTPLSAISSSTKTADVDPSDCKLIDVLTDDTDSRSSVDDGSNAQLVTAIADGVPYNRMEPFTSFVDPAVNCTKELLEPVEVKNSLAASASSVKHSLEPGSLCAEQRHEADKVKKHTLQTVSSCLEPIAECSTKQDEHVSDGSDVKQKLASARRIRYLETLLSRYHDTIKKLEEKELSLEEMDKEDSTYLLIDRYKSRIMKIWNKLCQLKGCTPNTRHDLEKTFRFEGTKYPCVNKMMTRYVSKYQMFPDYQDVRDIIIRCNDRHLLRLKPSYVDVLAREAFAAVGSLLQMKRMNDFVSNFGCHLTDGVRTDSDPAISDVKLRSELEENKKIGTSRLDEIVRKFADLQENNESIGSQHNSDDDSVSETVSQKLLSDFDGMLTDDMEDETVGTKQPEGVAEAELSAVAENVEVQASVSVAGCDAKELDQHAMSDSIAVDENRPTVASGDAAGISSTAAESYCQIPHISHDDKQSSPSVPRYVVGTFSNGSALTADTVAVTDDSSGEHVNLTASSPVIDIIDDDEDNYVIVDEPESSVSKRMKETVMSAWHSQSSDALKTVVEKALAHVSASHGTDSTSPMSIGSNILPAVTVSSSPAKQTTHKANTGSQSEVTCPRVTCRDSNTAASQSDVPTARVIGRIVSMCRSSPLVTSNAHRSVTTVTHSTNVVSGSVNPALTTVPVTSAANSTAQMSTTVARAKYSNVSSTAIGRASASSRMMSSGRRPGVRRGPRSRRIAVLRPEDLYEISSQIVTEVLQRNKQSAGVDVITCNDDDDADATVADADVLDSHHCNDVVVIDEPPLPIRQAAGTRRSHVPQVTPRRIAVANCVSTVSSSRKQLVIPSSSCQLLKPFRSRPAGTRNMSDDVRVVDATAHVVGVNDDIICCDDDSHDGVPDGSLERIVTSAVPENRVSAVDDDDVLICDTPVPSDNRVCSSSVRQHVTQPYSLPDICVGTSVMTVSQAVTHRRGESATSVTAPHTSAALLQRDVAVTDEVLLVEADNPSVSTSSETAQGNMHHCSVIILD